MTKMNPTVKAKWVAALRSGKYKQVQGQLREVEDDNASKTVGFCCLGVLCNLHAEAHPKIAAKEIEPDQYLGETEELPEQVRKWARLENVCGGLVRIGGRLDALTEHNDGGATFREIATAIEEQL